MSVPATSHLLERLRRFDGPGFFLGGGFVAGLLLFLVWLAMLPDRGKNSLRAQGGTEQAEGTLATPGEGVLTAITGEDNRGGAASNSGGASDFFEGGDEQADGETDGELANQDEFQAQDPDSMAIGEDVGAPVQMEEGAALTDSLLDPPRAAAVDDATTSSAPGAPLLPYYVEIEVAPGQAQVLQLNAESPEHARLILRDFRGDPRVLRGPSTEPLE